MQRKCCQGGQDVVALIQLYLKLRSGRQEKQKTTKGSVSSISTL